MQSEIITTIPSEIAERYQDELRPVFLAYGCVLLEGFTGIAYFYKAVNLESGDMEYLGQLRARLTPSCHEQMAQRIRRCDIADTGSMEADAPLRKRVNRDKLAAIQSSVFSELLPVHGYSIRNQQTELADHILSAICRRNITLSEAEVGIGKTHAYLIAAALAKRGRINDLWLKGNYPDLAYISSMPVVISTSSIALQNAIVRDYIPAISRILMAHGVINTPLSCALRKGREHYLCEKRLRNYLRYERHPDTKDNLQSLLSKRSSIDLGEADGLTPYTKSKIGVVGRCDRTCPYYQHCRYLAFLRDAQSDRYDFQVCNHNYLLADVLRRKDNQPPLIPHYQAVVIDEAHKFLGAARQMYGLEFSSATLPRIADDIRGFTFRQGESGSNVWRLAKKLSDHSSRLFRSLGCGLPQHDHDGEAERFPVVLDGQAVLQLNRIAATIDSLAEELSELHVLTRYKGRCAQVLWELEQVRDLATSLENHGEFVLWLEQPSDREIRICGIPKNLNEQLYKDFWSKGIPVALTSGTLSAAGDFSRIKRTLGLDKLPPSHVMETNATSPFHHRENALLYISNHVPFPDHQDQRYLTAVAEEVERLVRASHGHAAILFTSYKAMDMVWAQLQDKRLPFPLFRLNRGDAGVIDRFRESGNGVLFASGAMWEGIDLPGDILSMLIIVKLPFPVPDPISEHERTMHPNMESYKTNVIIPEMLMKLKQGFGRLIRTETDTGVVALLDSRVRPGSSYRESVLSALPDCRTTSNLSDVSAFLREKKSFGYFCDKEAANEHNA